MSEPENFLERWSRRKREAEVAPEADAQANPVVAVGTGQVSAPAASSNALASTTPGAVPEISDMIDIGQVDGRVAASSIRKVGEIVEKHPEEAVAIMRSWMYQGA